MTIKELNRKIGPKYDVMTEHDGSILLLRYLGDGTPFDVLLDINLCTDDPYIINKKTRHLAFTCILAAVRELEK